MRVGDKRIFSTPEAIAELVALRKKKWKVTKIAEHFGCDHTSVIYHLRKLGIGGYSNKAKYITKNRPEKFASDCCQKCGMKLNSEYHQKFPCK